MSGYCEPLLRWLGCGRIESLDVNAYEGASILHDMNFPVPSQLHDKYDFIYDGGTIEHIFHMPQVCQNIIDMLKVGGVFLSVTCNNNFSGHGMYQFSPEFFFSAFSKKYGMQIIEMFLAENETAVDTWVPLRPSAEHASLRNTTTIHTFTGVYIITIAKKVSSSQDRQCLLTSPPQQHSYEASEWLRKN